MRTLEAATWWKRLMAIVYDSLIVTGLLMIAGFAVLALNGVHAVAPQTLWFQIYPDMANAAAAGYDPVAELALCDGHLVAVHVKDSLPRTIRRVPFGAGIVPFERVFRTLAAMSYRGPLTVEMWADSDGVGDPMATVRAARQFVADLVDTTYSIPLPALAG